MSATSMVHVRIEEEIKAQATETLAAIGLSVSDAVRIFLRRVAIEKAIPFNVRVPNAETIIAIQELETGKGVRFNNIDELMADLNAND